MRSVKRKETQEGRVSGSGTVSSVYETYFCRECGMLWADGAEAGTRATCSECGAVEEREPGRSDFVFYPQEPSELLHSLREKFVESSGADHAEIDEPCPRCGNPKMRFTTVQMRSADEGQTVIYNCPQCNHTFQQNT
uniref:DNA-directed RNA polymerase I subunit RPA12 n=1 Tax=Compsopogon caeruleus TaxID=31354 RepID=A0A7S1X9J3_9RHOD|mmetsp:Transcript_10260/g.20698  ORF Transcript_10260/g.20698 Transcript_10260/m.20698 type:complete len:137 (+) Transcript_10260:136-546(+)|eukprot:CAMPEP_0184680312 /NCGR_PEP_ID=MMETSP0312-20130426/3178_1 /TAXON_ID=31354 /ORGANISM="Compsopogon coeruleus, Strain SAG 36.94" /LENGTH=136 /DNA_ID=CAMNT_0027130323 /DNA_START=105 /DNA_END=515 /DNA_ORIENTATION=-